MLELIVSQKTIASIKRMTYRQFLLQIINGFYSILGTYMLWKLIGILANNDSPIVVVLSESMSPGFNRGDILFLTTKEYTTGDMAVFQLSKREIPIVHRVIRKYGDRILTKGDNNLRDDTMLYRRGQYMLDPKDVVSVVFGNLPFFGMLTIWVNSYPYLKSIIILICGMSVFLEREE